MKQEHPIIETFGNRLRIRVNGVLVEDDKILLIKHKMPSEHGYFWAPPGGGMEYGSTAEENIVREFAEETGLAIQVKKFLFTHEFFSPPLHAIELFFEVVKVGGKLKKGFDPEMQNHQQIIEDIKFWSKSEIEKAKGPTIHQVLNFESDPNKILRLNGYFIFTNKSLK